MNCDKIIHDENCNIIVQEDNYDDNYAFVYILQLNQTTGITNQIFIKTSEEEPVIFDIGLDGFYTLVTLKVPKDSQAEYYYNNNNFYCNGTKIELQELIRLSSTTSEIKVTYDYYFQTCNLKKCFIDICYQIFDTPSICDNSKVDSSLIYKRDLIWSALNVIRYMSEMGQYEEAERLLERIMGCNGLCNNKCHSSRNSKCGCR